MNRYEHRQGVLPSNPKSDAIRGAISEQEADSTALAAWLWTLHLA